MWKIGLGISVAVVLLLVIFLFSQNPLTSSKKTANSNTLGLSVTKDDSLTSFKIKPAGPVNPGDSYEVTLQAKNSQGDFCKLCGIKVYFDEPQPGDEIMPNQGRLDNEGQFYTKITSFSPVDRTLLVDIRTSEDNLNTSSTPLSYNKNSVLSFVRLVTSTIGKVGSLPPMGNIYAKAVKQRYSGGSQREIDLTWNKPFGTRRVDIFSYTNDSSEEGKLVKTTSGDKTTIEIESAEDVYLNVKACTVGESCVDALPLIIPKLASESGELDVSNYGFTQPYEEIVPSEEKDSHMFDVLGPLKGWLAGLYSSFK